MPSGSLTQCARLSRLLQHEFSERKPLIVYASHTDFQQTNALPWFLDESTGGVTESLKSRMILPFTGSYADFDHVLTHELVHGFQYDVIFHRGLMVTESTPLLFWSTSTVCRVIEKVPVPSTKPKRSIATLASTSTF